MATPCSTKRSVTQVAHRSCTSMADPVPVARRARGSTSIRSVIVRCCWTSGRLVDAYNILLMDPDPAVHEAAAREWCMWEDAHVSTTPEARPNPRYDDARFRLGFARQVTHCWRNNSWLSDDEIVANAHRLAGI